MDTIDIRGLQVATCIGVPATERERWQTLELDVTLTPSTPFDEVADDLKHTVDYEAVCLALRDWAASNERQLLESLGEDLAQQLLRTYELCEVEISIRKFIIPGTASVGVHLNRKRSR